MLYILPSKRRENVKLYIYHITNHVKNAYTEKKEWKENKNVTSDSRWTVG